MGKELSAVIEENGIMYCMAKDGCYYPDLRLPEGTHYNIGKYGLMRWSICKQTAEGSICGC